MANRYYAVRKCGSEVARIEKASSPQVAARRAFARGVIGYEWKDLGTNAEVVRLETKRMAAIKDPKGWTVFDLT